jgi:predicted aspartyl protease
MPPTEMAAKSAATRGSPTLPLRYAGPHLVPAVDGTIDDMPATMLIDTGSDRTVLTRTGVEKRGLTMRATEDFAIGVSGYSRVYTSRIKELGLGKTRIQRVFELPVIGSTTSAPSYDAVIGATFLFEMDMEISLKDKVINLYRGKHCDDTYLGFWKEGSITIPFAPGHGNSPQPHIEVTLNGAKLDAVIDTGASRTVITRDAAERAGIKMDGPSVKRLADSGGVGSVRVPNWSTTFDSVSIGGETVHKGELGIIDPRGGNRGWDMLLGQDFLRAHHVLFALDQHKLYLAYVGGPVFTRGDALEPWIEQEANGGNADAQYVLAMKYRHGHGVAQDAKQSKAWLEKAATNGSARAGIELGYDLIDGGHYADAIARMRPALEQLPAERYGELWLYLARVLNGEGELGKTELASRIAKHQDDTWPTPVASFYLGKIDADELLKQAAHGEDPPEELRCEAKFYMSAIEAAAKDKERAHAVLAAEPDCTAAPKQKKDAI